MKIRDFKDSDAEAVAKLSNANSEFFQYKEVTPDFLRKMCAKPGFKMFVLADGHDIIGFCGVNFEKLPIAEIGPICVEGSRRTHGLGRLLLARIFEFLQDMRPVTAVIKVKASNKVAQEFFSFNSFKKGGFVECRGEALWMEKQL